MNPRNVDALAALIREVDGDHSLGAGALAEALAARGVLATTALTDDDVFWLDMAGMHNGVVGVAGRRTVVRQVDLARPYLVRATLGGMATGDRAPVGMPLVAFGDFVIQDPRA